jgi:hypothetical protein
MAESPSTYKQVSGAGGGPLMISGSLLLLLILFINVLCCKVALRSPSVEVRSWRAPCQGGVFPVGERAIRLSRQLGATGTAIVCS